MKNLILLLLAIAPAVGFAAEKEPKDVLCQGLRDYPKGANLTFGKGSVVGDPSDFSVAYPEGKIGILYFQYMSNTNSKTIKGEVTKIDVQDNFKVVYKNQPVTCTVRSWQ